MRRAAALATVLVALPALAEACAVCGAGTAERNRAAFFATTVLLSLLPLALLGAGLLWLRRQRVRRTGAGAARDAGSVAGRPREAGPAAAALGGAAVAREG